MFSVKVSNACKSYGKGENKVDILKEMNLHVETGSM
jgi:ABC-type lipoprotein export system ATPase subunit